MSRQSRGDLGSMNISRWDFWQDVTAAETDSSAKLQVGEERLRIAMENNPHLRKAAEKLVVHKGVRDPFQILHHFRLRNNYGKRR